MESTEEHFHASADHHHHHNHRSMITKGRRTKRQRSSALTSASSSQGGGGGGGGGGGCSEYNNYSSSSSGSRSDEHDDIIMSQVTTEEEDMANCLILLAQGGILEKKKRPPPPSLSSSNICVYECKTCNRSFPSFQALGGHRASHKKPRLSTSTTNVLIPTSDNDQEAADQTVDDPQEEPSLLSTNRNNINIMSGATAGATSNTGGASNKARVHECSICGSEFPSGQALGGHMRRHRGPPPPPPPPGPPPQLPPVTGGGPIKMDSDDNRSVLPLDLNLPAPDDDDHHHHHAELDHLETKFVHHPPPPLHQPQQQHIHVLPTPALVDCHY